MIYDKILKFITEERVDVLSRFSISETGALLFDNKPIESNCDNSQLSEELLQLNEFVKNIIVERINDVSTEITEIKPDIHKHTNLNIIDKLTQNDGDLFYNDINITNSEIQGDMKKEIYDTNSNGVIDKAETLDGMNVSIEELNYLVGTSSNIQEQFNAIRIGYSLKGTVGSFDELTKMDTSTIHDGYAYIVEVDETKNNQKTGYLRSSDEWVYLGVFEVQLRDFKTNPILLDSEVSGLLEPKNISDDIARVSQLHKHSVSDEVVKNLVKNSHNHAHLDLLETISQNELGEIFISNKKITSNVIFFDIPDFLPKVGSADTLYIVKKDETNSSKPSVYIYMNGGYQKIFDNNKTNEPSNGIMNQITKLNVSAPQTVHITINRTEDFNLPDINVLQFKPGEQNIINVISDFDSNDRLEYDENKFIDFDGIMKLKTTVYLDSSKSEEQGKILYTYEINKADFERIISF